MNQNQYKIYLELGSLLHAADAQMHVAHKTIGLAPMVSQHLFECAMQSVMEALIKHSELYMAENQR